jgi:hypothetical protein
MNWSKWIRQSHRWLSIIFTAIVIGIFIAIGIGKQPAPWVYYLLLPSLFLMLLSGLYLFLLPYSARRSGQRLEGKV